MRSILRLSPLPWLALAFAACSGAAEPEAPAPTLETTDEIATREGDAEFALRAGRDGGGRDRDGRGRRGRHHGGRPPRGESCEVAGQTFRDGKPVPSGDSCNTCACDDGSVVCTEIACEPVVCAAFVEVPDGVCSRFPLDPCISQDPDCLPEPEPGSCEAAGQSFPDGSAVPSGDSCNSCGCNDGSIVCTLALCEPVACALFVEESDGVCSRFPLDPCISQDPDCLPEQEPEPEPGSCEAAGQTFPNGSAVPSGDSCNSCGCNDGSIVCTLALCEPVACAQFLELPDGVCSRFPLDPCKFQDADCTEEQEATP